MDDLQDTSAATSADPADTAEHAHTWDKVTSECTHPGCHRTKPDWLTDTTDDTTATSRPAHTTRRPWPRIPPVGRWFLALTFVALLLHQGGTYAHSVMNSGGANSDQPIIQRVDPDTIHPRTAPAVAPTAVPPTPSATK